MRSVCPKLGLFPRVMFGYTFNVFPCEVEKSPFARRLIAQRVADGLADDAPIFPDIQTCDLSGVEADVFMGGFPCQGVCQAGDQLGLQDERTGLIGSVWKHYDQAEVKPNLG